MFYAAVDEKENYKIVDGLQRLSTLKGFALNKSLKLKGLEFWSEYNGKKFDDLPPHLQNRILESQFYFIIINHGTPERAKRDIFKRINTGGLPLTDQEIRHALYTGHSTSILKKLVESQKFNSATDNCVKDGRMAGRELILRALSFMIREPKDYSNSNMDDWLSHTMQIINLHRTSMPENHKFEKKIKELLFGDENSSKHLPPLNFMSEEELTSRFYTAMERAEKLFGRYAFRKTLTGERRSPINKSLFEVWTVLLSSIDDTDFMNIEDKKELLIEQLKQLYINDKSFHNSISSYSHDPKFVKIRHTVIKEKIESMKEG